MSFRRSFKKVETFLLQRFIDLNMFILIHIVSRNEVFYNSTFKKYFRKTH